MCRLSGLPPQTLTPNLLEKGIKLGLVLNVPTGAEAEKHSIYNSGTSSDEEEDI